jgi:hypothetical protein
MHTTCIRHVVWLWSVLSPNFPWGPELDRCTSPKFFPPPPLFPPKSGLALVWTFITHPLVHHEQKKSVPKIAAKMASVSGHLILHFSDTVVRKYPSIPHFVKICFFCGPDTSTYRLPLFLITRHVILIWMRKSRRGRFLRVFANKGRGLLWGGGGGNENYMILWIIGSRLGKIFQT